MAWTIKDIISDVSLYDEDAFTDIIDQQWILFIEDAFVNKRSELMYLEEGAFSKESTLIALEGNRALIPTDCPMDEQFFVYAGTDKNKIFPLGTLDFRVAGRKLLFFNDNIDGVYFEYNTDSFLIENTDTEIPFLSKKAYKIIRDEVRRLAYNSIDAGEGSEASDQAIRDSESVI